MLAVWRIRPPKRACDRRSLRRVLHEDGTLLPRTLHRVCPLVLHGQEFWGRMDEAASTTFSPCCLYMRRRQPCLRLLLHTIMVTIVP